MADMSKVMKTCSKCGVEKSLGDFHRKASGKHGRNARCGACVKEADRRYRRDNPEKASAQSRRYYAANREKAIEATRRWRENNPEKYREASRRRTVFRKYGIALEVYDTHMALGCKICGARQDMHMDHDHGTGKLRGALCGACNRALGIMEDSPARLEDAAAYLRAAA